MIIVIISSFLAVILTFMESKWDVKKGMFWGFVLVTTLAAIHYDYGMDYMSYLQTFENLSNYGSLSQMIDSETVRQNQYGWVFINWVFSLFGQYGFFWMVAVLSVLQNWIYYTFIRKYVPKEWWALAVTIYLFSTHFFLINFSMMRQGLAIALFLLAYMLSDKRKFVLSFAIVFAAAFIHRSCMIMLPFVFWPLLPMKRGKLLAISYLFLFLLLFFDIEVLDKVFDTFMSVEDFDYYNQVHGDKSKASHFGIGFFLNMIPFVVSLLFISNEKRDVNERRITALACVGTMVIPFTQIIALANRLGIYFMALNFAAIPYAYRAIRQKEIRTVLLVVYIGMLFLEYYIFLTDPVFSLSYLNFKTIFSVL